MFRGVECPHEMSSRRVLETLEIDRRTSGDSPVSSSKVCSVVSVELTGGDTGGVVSVCDMLGDWLGGIGRSLAAFIYAFVGVDRWWWGAQLCMGTSSTTTVFRHMCRHDSWSCAHVECLHVLACPGVWPTSLGWACVVWCLIQPGG